MPGIFISYRREDRGGYAGRLFDILSAQFGSDNLFMDLGTLKGGDDYAELIPAARHRLRRPRGRQRRALAHRPRP